MGLNKHLRQLATLQPSLSALAVHCKHTTMHLIAPHVSTRPRALKVSPPRNVARATEWMVHTTTLMACINRIALPNG